MAKRQLGLGRGLDELFGADEREDAVPAELDINLIEPSRDQPRKHFSEEGLAELAESIALHGVIVPITVRKIGEDRYRIVAGERRYRASRMAGKTSIPVHVVEADELHAMEMALVENLQRQDLDPIEEAEGIRTLIDRYGMRQEDAAARLSRSRPAVTNALRLLELPPRVKELVADGTLSAGHGRAIAALDDPRLAAAAAERAAADGLNVRQTEALVKRLRAAAAPGRPARGDGVDYAAELSRRLSDRLGREVTVSVGRGKAGRVTLNFSDMDDLDRIIDLLERAGAGDGIAEQNRED